MWFIVPIFVAFFLAAFAIQSPTVGSFVISALVMAGGIYLKYDGNLKDMSWYKVVGWCLVIGPCVFLALMLLGTIMSSLYEPLAGSERPWHLSDVNYSGRSASIKMAG